MSDILSEYGRDSNQPQKERASEGGCCHPKDLPYSPPVGPRNKTDIGHSGTNHGMCGSQGKH